MNMFKPTKATNNKEYFDMLPEDRKKTMLFLDNLINKTAPSLKPNFLYNMPGYGSFKYINYKREKIDWPTIAIASQKNYISLYICALDKNKYLAEKYRSELGRVNVGRSCIRFKKLDGLNIDILKKIIKLAEKSPGLVIK